MKSLRASLTISMLITNFLIITLMSLGTLSGFIVISKDWESNITIDITAMLNTVLSEEYSNIDSLGDLDSDDFQNLLDSTLEIHKGRLRAIRFISEEKETLFSFDIADSSDHHKTNLLKPELIRWISNLRTFNPGSIPRNTGTLMGRTGIKLGMVEIASSPLMGHKYSDTFDLILTEYFILGLILASLISVLMSFILSKRLSRHSKLFAAQLTMMANGSRNINFTNGTNREMQSSSAAAASLQNELKNNEHLQQKKLQDIVHDLKTPTAALGIQFEALKEGILELDKHRIDILTTEFKMIQEMIIELSNYTKLTSEDYVPEPILFDAIKLITESINKFDIQIDKKRQSLKFNNTSDSVMIKSDRIGLMRVMNNLIVNAINNAPGETEIEISVKKRKNIISDQELLCVEIENSGKIEEEDLPFIFERLYRSKRSGYQGNGLGLAIAKTIVEKNGGKLTALNTAYEKVIFRIEIPVNYEKHCLPVLPTG